MNALIAACQEAGRAIMAVYGDAQVWQKPDGSPLTDADLASEAVLQAYLKTTGIPVVSEESDVESDAHTYWLVDPLDGTKEFVKRNGEFTVNVALIEHGVPTIGVVHAPVLDKTYVGTPTEAYLLEGHARTPLQPRGEKRLRVVTSRSHPNPAMATFLEAAEHVAPIKLVPTGSSLKICLIAEGLADLYPRLGPTMQWDTAAAHAVLRAAGGQLTQVNGAALHYGGPDRLNPWFVAHASRDGLPRNFSAWAKGQKPHDN